MRMSSSDLCDINCLAYSALRKQERPTPQYVYTSALPNALLDEVSNSELVARPTSAKKREGSGELLCPTGMQLAR